MRSVPQAARARTIRIGAAVAVAALGAAGAAAAGLNGSYATSVAAARPRSLEGRWTLELVLDTNMSTYLGGRFGSYTLLHNGRLRSQGTYALTYSATCDGTRSTPCSLVEFDQLGGPQPCPQTNVGGVYAYTTPGGKLRLEPVRESCRYRQLVLTRRLLVRRRP